jgi:hypothetical protein
MGIPFSDPHLAQLAAVLNFTEDDLIANRAGQITPVQIERLAHDLRWQYEPLVGIAGLTALILGAIGLAAGLPNGIVLCVPALLVMSLGLGGILVLRHQINRLPSQPARCVPLHMGRIASIQRRRGLSDGDRHALFCIEINGQRLFAGYRLYPILRANQEYRTYYAPVNFWNGCRILSMEPVGGPNDTPAGKGK